MRRRPHLSREHMDFPRGKSGWRGPLTRAQTWCSHAARHSALLPRAAGEYHHGKPPPATAALRRTAPSPGEDAVICPRMSRALDGLAGRRLHQRQRPCAFPCRDCTGDCLCSMLGPRVRGSAPSLCMAAGSLACCLRPESPLRSVASVCPALQAAERAFSRNYPTNSFENGFLSTDCT
jgi:hypothetical protein